MLNKCILGIIFITFFSLSQRINAQSFPMGNGTFNTCSGTFYDSGGAGGNYSNNENSTITFCSSIPGQEIFLSFTSFNTESGFDDITIYDGNSTGAPLIGTYDGTVSPGTISSTNGCLTIVFSSDGSVTNPGWAATISCGTPPPPPPPTVQDCDGAIAVCQNIFNQGTSFSGTGNNPSEITSANSCLGGAGEVNSVWYIFTTQTTGNVCFNITPNVGSDDYDWGVYDITNNPCGDIATNASLEVSCNFSGTSGVTGANGSGGAQNEPCIPVTAGQTYVLAVQNWSGSTNGYQLDFGASSATIFDNVPPSIQSVNLPIACGDTSLTFDFSENILCNTLQAGDFVLTGPGGPYTVNSVTGVNCAAGGNQENTFTITINPAITVAGAYQICLGNAAASVTDLCGNVAPPACLSFSVTNPIVADAGLDISTCLNTLGNIVPIAIGGSPTGSGGTGLTYSWAPTTNLNNANIANPTASPTTTTTYTVTVADASGCRATDAVTVTINNLNAPTMATTPETCLGANDGTATATPTNGTPGYTYSWTPSGQTTQTATGLTPINYTVTVTDANGCGATNNITVLAGPPILAGFTPPINQCLTGNSFTFTNTGTAGVTYAWNFGDGGTSTAQNPTHSYATAGTFTVTQTVSSGSCSASFNITVTVFDIPVPTAMSTPVLCNGDATGTATVTTPVTPGPGPFSFQWDAAAGNQNIQTATGLAANSYTVTVTDQTTNCQGQVTVVVTEPTPLTASETHTNPICSGASDGSATATGAGGTPGYTYQWDAAAGNQNTQTATGLTLGSYIATVTDANGCQTTITATLTDPAGMVLNATMTQANCGQPDGSATVTITSGGTGPYSYSWDDISSQTTQTAANIIAGTYNVVVTDNATGCNQTTSITVTTTVGIAASVVLDNDALCNGSSDGQATATPTGGTSPFTYAWTPSGQTTAILTAGAGTYTVVITDALGCSGNASVTINEPTAITASISGFNNVTCFGGNDGNATALGSGGTSPYTYQWDAAAGNQNTQTATGLAAVSYIVTVTDANGCFTTASVTIVDGVSISSTITGTDVNCNGGNDGTIDLTPSGGTAPYTYAWTPSGSTAEDPNGLTVGTHNVTITSQEGCMTTNSIIINEPTLLVAVIDSSFDATCFGFSDGSAFASATGGTAPYTYSWSTTPIQNTAAALFIPFGVYTITITDANNCTATAIVNINQPPALAATVGSINAYCGVDQGTVWTSPTNGTAPYTYTWDSTSTVIGNTDTINGLYPGNYGLVIDDVNGCKFNTTVTVIADPGGVASISSFTDVSCTGLNDGTATVSVGGAFPGFIYLWDPAAGNQITNPVTGLALGSYNVTITDTFGCVMTTSVSISQPSPLSISMVANDKICPDSCNATAEATPSGGTLPYFFSWNDPLAQVTQTAINLCTGNVIATITDNNGCMVLDSVVILNPPAMVLSSTITSANCNQADGSATIAVSANGIAPFTYQWSDGTNIVGNTDTLSNVIAGTYFAIASDSLGCSIIDTVTIPNLAGPSLTLDSLYNVQCFGGNDGYAEVQITGGVFPYVYLWDDLAAQTTPSASNLAAGSYVVTVTDSNGCVVSTAVTVTEPSQLQLTAGGTDPSCFTFNDGSVWVNAIGGTSPYTYLWNDPSAQTNDTAITLVTGNYTVTVVDSNACFDTILVNLVDPLLFLVNVTGTNASCFNVCDGIANTTLTNGITPFTYLWNDPSAQNTSSAIGLCDTTINVVVTDAMGCIANGSITIIEPALLVATENTHGDVSCAGGNDGFSSVNVIGGTGPYTYDWVLSGSSVSSNQGAPNLITGSYTVTITDANGCTDNIVINITEPNPLTAVFIASDADCNGASTGEASVIATGGTAPYNYQWDDVALQQTDTAFNLLANTVPGYSVVVTDFLMCTVTVNNIIINEPTAITLSASTVSSTCGANNGSATVSVGGGTPNYTFAWNDANSQGTATANSLIAGNYVVIVTDANGCVDSTTANVTDLGSPTVTIPTNTNVSCNGASDGTAQSNVTGGAAPYFYSWNTGNIGDTLANVTGLDAQTYSVTVTDNNGCIASASAIIAENAGVTAVINNFNNISCNGVSDGGAAVIVAGGTGAGTYTFLWDDPSAQTTALATGLTANTYFVIVTDNNGCTANDTVTLSEPVLLTISQDSLSNTLCNGSSDGFIRITTNGGTNPIASYVWTPNISSGAIASGLTAGSYSVSVTDDNGCVAVGNYDILEPNQLVVDTVTVASTCGLPNGTATVSIVTGSTPAYTYNWNDPLNQNTATADSLAAGNYVVTITDANNCSVTQNVTIANVVGPVIDSVIVTAITCNGFNDGTAQVFASGGTTPYTYLWNDPAAQTVDLATALAPSPPFYNVIVTDVNGCTSTPGIAQITEPTIINPVINAPDTICYGEILQLFANANGGAPPYLSFNWSGGVNQQGQGPIFDTITTSTTYTIVVVDANLCTSVPVSKTIIVRPRPTFTISDETICQGDSATLTPINITGGDPNKPFNFFWMEIDSTTLTLSPTGIPNPVNPITLSPSDSSNYIVWVENFGCSTSDTLGVTIYVNDTVIVGLDAPIRQGCPELVVGIETIYVSGDTTNAIYSWDFGDGGFSSGFTDSLGYTYINSGVYDVTLNITTANGCESTFIESGWINVFPEPIADFITNPSPSIVTLIDPTFNFIDQSFGANTWNWDFGDDSTDLVNQNPMHTYQDTGFYDVTLVVTNVPYGCIDTVTKTVQVKPAFFFAIPNSFTPNGDGLNEVFFPGTLLGASEKDYSFFIFNRWGELIFEGHHLDSGWNGSYKGEIVPVGVYVWVVEIKDLNGTNHLFNGNVSVVK